MDVFDSMKAILALFGGLALWSLFEGFVPLRPRDAWSRKHLLPNLALTTLTFATAAALNGAMLLSLLWAERSGIGLFNAVSIPAWIAFVGAIVALDLAWYVTHLSMHKVPTLWRMHTTHHSDPMVDVTTTARQHPLESLLRYAYLIVFGVAFGASPPAFVVYRIWSAVHGQFEHANLRLPQRMDTALTLLFSSPNMHKIHHSRERQFTDTNYSNIFSVWDRLFGTFTPSRLGRRVDYGLDDMIFLSVRRSLPCFANRSFGCMPVTSRPCQRASP